MRKRAAHHLCVWNIIMNLSCLNTSGWSCWITSCILIWSWNFVKYSMRIVVYWSGWVQDLRIWHHPFLVSILGRSKFGRALSHCALDTETGGGTHPLELDTGIHPLELDTGIHPLELMLGELKKWPGSLDIGAGLWNICLRTHLLELTLRNWRYSLDH